MEEFEKDQKNSIIIYFLMIISTVLTIFIIPNYFPTYTRILNVLIWIVIFLRARTLANQHNRFKGQKDKLKTIFLIVFIYLIGYYLSGIFFGYTSTIYSQSITSIISNFVFYIFVIMLQEYTRSRLVNNTRSFSMYALITIMLIILSFNYNNFLENFSTGEKAFKFIASEIYPVIIHGILCTFLVKIGSYKLSLMFLLPVEILKYLVPIQPDIDWFVIIALQSALVLITYYYIYYEHLINVERYTRKEIQKGSPKATIPAIIFVIAFTFFIAGIFPIKPIALLSNSMKPYIKRGDVVLVKKVEQDDIKNICIGDIVEYTLENKVVIHRVINIVEGSGGKRTFTTKGDANSTADEKPVEENQIVGIVKYYIPVIGYPSVIFSEKILKVGNN
jgi:signal peptidase